MTLLSSRTVRAKIVFGKPFASTPITDVATGQTIETARGNATSIQLGFFSARTNEVLDLSDVESLTLLIQPSQTENDPLASKTLAAAALDLTLAAETWADGTKQHAEFSFTNAEMNINPSGSKKTFWLVVTALMDDGTKVTLAAGSFILHEDNDAAADPPPENPGTAITVEEADARYQQGLCLLRTANEGPPTNPLIRVTGTLAGSGGAVVFPELSARESLNGKEYYTDSYGSITYSCRWETSGGARWILAGTDGGTARTWSSTEDVATPDLVTEWTPASGTTGTPTIVRFLQLPAVAIGQDLRLGDEQPFRWFKAAEIDPVTLWDELTRAVIDNRDSGTGERMFIEDGTIQTEVVNDGGI